MVRIYFSYYLFFFYLFHHVLLVFEHLTLLLIKLAKCYESILYICPFGSLSFTTVDRFARLRLFQSYLLCIYYIFSIIVMGTVFIVTQLLIVFFLLSEWKLELIVEHAFVVFGVGLNNSEVFQRVTWIPSIFRSWQFLNRIFLFIFLLFTLCLAYLRCRYLISRICIFQFKNIVLL